MPRKAGSGLHKEVSRAIESLTAALFEGSPSAPALTRIKKEQEAGRSGVSPRAAHRWISSIVDQLALPVASASLPPNDYLGDIHLTLEDGSSAFVEVKAQTTKPFTELIQADWVKGVTDAVRWVFAEDEYFRAAQPGWLAEMMEERSPSRYFGSWTFGDLWAADVALLTDRNRRRIAGVEEPRDLHEFLGRKFLLQVSREGARLVRLDRIPTIAQVISGGPVNWTIEPKRKSTSIKVSAGSGPAESGFDFVYYVGYTPKIVGRHKLTARAIAEAEGVIEVR